MYFKQLSVRFFSVGRAVWASDKSSLALLRKKTGYTFANCKKALELHGNDVVKVRSCEILEVSQFEKIFFRRKLG